MDYIHTSSTVFSWRRIGMFVVFGNPTLKSFSWSYLILPTNKKIPQIGLLYVPCLEIITNIKDICNIANNHFINSIRKLRDNIPKITTTPVEILKKIYPRVETTLEIPIPTVKDITETIKKSKSKNSVGCDNISMNMLKKQ